jgi:uncharacterized protein YndB with AHSA1/START domain
MSSDDDRPPVELTVEIDAPPELVWEALTDPQRLIGWYAAEAKTTPGEGGSIWVAWGQDVAGSSQIEVWEPGRRLRLGDESATVVEYTLEVRGGRTVLRLVHSGFERSGWDDEYDLVRRHWPIFLRTLKYALERHASARWAARVLALPLDRPLEQAWDDLLGPDGLGMDSGGLAAGTVLLADPPLGVAVAADALDGGVLAVFFEQAGDSRGLTLMLFTYDEGPRATAGAQRIEEVTRARL